MGDPGRVGVNFIGDRIAVNLLKQSQIGLPEVCARGKKRLAGHFCQGVGEAVSKIETRWMASLSKFSPGETRDRHLFHVNCDNLDFCPLEEQVQLTTGCDTAAGFHDDCRFQGIRRRQ